MKRYILILPLLYCSILFSQIPSQPRTQPTRIGALATSPNDTSFTKDPVDTNRVYIVVKNSKGVIRSRGTLVNGKKDGTWRDYSDPGDLIKIDEYKMGVKNGASVGLTQAGMVTLDATYSSDSLNGQKTIYQPNGRIKSTEEYSNGILHGRRNTFYEDTTPMEESNYKYGVRDGLCRWYSQNGKISVEYNYINGKLEGPSKEYFSNGNIKREGIYKNDNEEGEWKEFNDSMMVKKIIFKNGVVVKETKVKK